MTADVYTVLLSPRRIAYYARCLACDWSGKEHIWDRHTLPDSTDRGDSARRLAGQDVDEHNDAEHPNSQALRFGTPASTETPPPTIAALTDWLSRTTFTAEDAEALGRIIAARTREPLPTEPGFYVDRLGQAWHLAHGAEWHRLFSEDEVIEDSDPFELSPLRKMEPAADTAAAVLRAIDNMWSPGATRVFSYHAADTIMTRFGVEKPL